MNSNLWMLPPIACLALFVSACGSGTQNQIVGKWEVAGAQMGGVDDENAATAAKAAKMSAEFASDGTAKMAMMGQTLQGKYEIVGGNELDWTMAGITTKSKMNLTATELDLTDEANRTIRYKRQ